MRNFKLLVLLSLGFVCVLWANLWFWQNQHLEQSLRWSAQQARPGLSLLSDQVGKSIDQLRQRIESLKSGEDPRPFEWIAVLKLSSDRLHLDQVVLEKTSEPRLNSVFDLLVKDLRPSDMVGQAIYFLTQLGGDQRSTLFGVFFSTTHQKWLGFVLDPSFFRNLIQPMVSSTIQFEIEEQNQKLIFHLNDRYVGQKSAPAGGRQGSREIVEEKFVSGSNLNLRTRVSTEYLWQQSRHDFFKKTLLLWGLYFLGLGSAWFWFKRTYKLEDSTSLLASVEKISVDAAAAVRKPKFSQSEIFQKAKEVVTSLNRVAAEGARDDEKPENEKLHKFDFDNLVRVSIKKWDFVSDPQFGGKAEYPVWGHPKTLAWVLSEIGKLVKQEVKDQLDRTQVSSVKVDVQKSSGVYLLQIQVPVSELLGTSWAKIQELKPYLYQEQGHLRIVNQGQSSRIDLSVPSAAIFLTDASPAKDVVLRGAPWTMVDKEIVDNGIIDTEIVEKEIGKSSGGPPAPGISSLENQRYMSPGTLPLGPTTLGKQRPLDKHNVQIRRPGAPSV